MVNFSCVCCSWVVLLTYEHFWNGSSKMLRDFYCVNNLFSVLPSVRTFLNKLFCTWRTLYIGIYFWNQWRNRSCRSQERDARATRTGRKSVSARAVAPSDTPLRKGPSVGPTASAAVGQRTTAVRGPTAANVGPAAFAHWDTVYRTMSMEWASRRVWAGAEEGENTLVNVFVSLFGASFQNNTAGDDACLSCIFFSPLNVCVKHTSLHHKNTSKKNV